MKLSSLLSSLYKSRFCNREGFSDLLFLLQVEAVVTKDELQHLTFLCKSEVDSMGRIVAGVLRVLKLEESVGHAALNQLSNLGTLISNSSASILRRIALTFSSS